MPKLERIGAEAGLAALRAVAEPTRLRILMLLAAGELTVKDLTIVLGQSQPRISRHLKLMHEAGLISRFQEGSWVYVRLVDAGPGAKLLRDLVAAFDPEETDFRRDGERLQALREERSARAQSYFATHAARWDQLRALHIDESEVERRMAAMLGEEPIDLLVDLGTGTGRILELFAGHYRRAIGVDTNQEMLAYARARIGGASLLQTQIRLGDIVNLALADRCADAVVMHQVLHFLADPAPAIREAARILKPGGKLLIVDFAPHQVDRLRDQFAHQRLGFAASQMEEWCVQAGLCFEQHQSLAPNDGAEADGLTVSLWLAVQPTEPNTRRASAEKSLEIAR